MHGSTQVSAVAFSLLSSNQVGHPEPPQRADSFTPLSQLSFPSSHLVNPALYLFDAPHASVRHPIWTATRRESTILNSPSRSQMTALSTTSATSQIHKRNLT